jgi:hypothetical protein
MPESGRPWPIRLQTFIGMKVGKSLRPMTRDLFDIVESVVSVDDNDPEQ